MKITIPKQTNKQKRFHALLKKKNNSRKPSLDIEYLRLQQDPTMVDEYKWMKGYVL